VDKWTRLLAEAQLCDTASVERPTPLSRVVLVVYTRTYFHAAWIVNRYHCLTNNNASPAQYS